MPDFVSGLLSPIMQSDAARSSSNQQYDAQMSAQAQTQGQFDITQQNYKDAQALQLPWVEAGRSALSAQQDMLGKYPDLSTTAYQQSDYDKWVMSQGTNALMAGGAATGMYGSGNLGAALSDYGQNQAGSQYQQWRNNALGDYTNQYNQLAGLSGTGQYGAAGMAGNTQNNNSLSMNAAATMGNYGIGGANALAAGQIGASNAWSNMYSNLGNSMTSGLGSFLNYQQNQNLTNALQSNTGYGGGYGGGSLSGGYGSYYGADNAYNPNYGAYANYGSVETAGFGE